MNTNTPSITKTGDQSTAAVSDIENNYNSQTNQRVAKKTKPDKNLGSTSQTSSRSRKALLDKNVIGRTPGKIQRKTKSDRILSASRSPFTSSPPPFVDSNYEFSDDFALPPSFSSCLPPGPDYDEWNMMLAESNINGKFTASFEEQNIFKEGSVASYLHTSAILHEKKKARQARESTLWKLGIDLIPLSDNTMELDMLRAYLPSSSTHQNDLHWLGYCLDENSFSNSGPELWSAEKCERFAREMIYIGKFNPPHKLEWILKYSTMFPSPPAPNINWCNASPPIPRQVRECTGAFEGFENDTQIYIYRYVRRQGRDGTQHWINPPKDDTGAYTMPLTPVNEEDLISRADIVYGTNMQILEWSDRIDLDERFTSGTLKLEGVSSGRKNLSAPYLTIVFECEEEERVRYRRGLWWEATQQTLLNGYLYLIAEKLLLDGDDGGDADAIGHHFLLSIVGSNVELLVMKLTFQHAESIGTKVPIFRTQTLRKLSMRCPGEVQTLQRDLYYIHRYGHAKGRAHRSVIQSRLKKHHNEHRGPQSCT